MWHVNVFFYGMHIKLKKYTQSHNDKSKWIPWLRSWFHQKPSLLSHSLLFWWSIRFGAKTNKNQMKKKIIVWNWSNRTDCITHTNTYIHRESRRILHKTTWINSYLVLMFMIILYLLHLFLWCWRNWKESHLPMCFFKAYKFLHSFIYLLVWLAFFFSLLHLRKTLESQFIEWAHTYTQWFLLPRFVRDDVYFVGLSIEWWFSWCAIKLKSKMYLLAV